MAPSTSLIGPPELHRPSEPSPQSPSAESAASGDPFTDAMAADFTSLTSLTRGRTENHSATFLASGNPCVDFFFHVVPNTPPQAIAERLHKAWSHDALTTLKLIANLRGVRGTGKSDKEGFYTAALWLHRHHPKTLALNVPALASFGYFKDFPEILYRLLEGSDVRKIAKQARRNRSSGVDLKIAKQLPISKEKAREEREKRRVRMAKKAVDRFDLDPDYRFLHESISDLFADCLKSDIEELNSGRSNKISLAAKWCPSLDSSFDRSTLLCEAIARKMFPPESSPEYAAIDDAHYAYRVRDRLRKEILVPLRRALELPEIYMSANRWNELPYNRVPSVAMKSYKKLFEKHDFDRFHAYLASVATGESKIAAGALLPHEVIRSLEEENGGDVAELQWKRIVDDLAKSGTMSSCIAVADVSGSMVGTPMEVSVALALLVSELTNPPWKGKVITFSEDPMLHTIEGDDLKSKALFVSNMEWGGSTNFRRVFERILEVAVEAQLEVEKMVKRVFVFSDMEFGEASESPWETDYEVVKRRFEEEGYGSAVPEMVFWNLRDSRSTPVPENQVGVAMVSGFSKNLLSLFLGNGGVLTPVDCMVAAVAGEAYEKLVVVD